MSIWNISNKQSHRLMWRLYTNSKKNRNNIRNERRKNTNKNDDDDDQQKNGEKMNCNHILRKFYVCYQIHIILHHRFTFVSSCSSLFFHILLKFLPINHRAYQNCMFVRFHFHAVKNERRTKKIMVIDGVADYSYYYFYYNNEIVRHWSACDLHCILLSVCFSN